jgi:cystathionine beta-lyase
MEKLRKELKKRKGEGVQAMDKRFAEIIDRRNSNSVKWDGLKKAFGREDILPMWVADSDWPAPEVVLEALRERVAHGVFGYTEPGEDLARAVVNWVKRRYNWEIKKEWLVYSSGVVPAINVALRTFTGPGGHVVVQPPVYYPFFSAVEKSGAKLVENQLLYAEDQYRMDFQDLEEKLKEMGKTGSREPGRDSLSAGAWDGERGNPADILILCSPHNPVGRVWTREELERLAELALKYNLIIISDEIHGDLVYSENIHIPLASLGGEISRRTITMIAPSKTFNLAGLATSVNIIPDRKMREAFIRTMSGLVIGGNVLGYTAMEAAYTRGDEWLEGQLKYLEGNRDYAVEYINQHIPGLRVQKAEGTYLLWLDCRGLGLSDPDLKKFFIEEARVGLNPGIIFGKGGEGFMRMNIACPRSLLEEGLRRIKWAVDYKFS